jgi:hypothetical protein
MKGVASGWISITDWSNESRAAKAIINYAIPEINRSLRVL